MIDVLTELRRTRRLAVLTNKPQQPSVACSTGSG
jgi:hypothetical protein